MNETPAPQPLAPATGSAIADALKAAATLALTCHKPELATEFRMRAYDAHRLRQLCIAVESWAAHHACNNRSVSPLADEVYKACLEMRRIIYAPNAEVRHGAKDADLD